MPSATTISSRDVMVRTPESTSTGRWPVASASPPVGSSSTIVTTP
jgi:hypothetical protein